MEASKEEISSSGVAVKGDEGSQGFCLAARGENPLSQPGAPNMAAASSPVNLAGVPPSSDSRKKRGRPRKYGSDGAAAAALSPMPISASIPLSGDFSGWKQPRARPLQSIKKAQKVEFESLGDRLAYFVGANFTPHVITVNAGEDVAMKVLSFSQQESRAICVLSASGSISNVTLRQPNSSGGTLTYEGRFEILSLSGSFMPTDNGIMKSRSGGMSVSLAGPDGRVLGGGLAGLLVAASPVQVVLGSFLPGHHQEHKPKKQRAEPATTAAIPAIINNQVPEGGYGGQKVNFTSPPPSFHTDNLPSMNSMQMDPMDLEADINESTPEGGSDDFGDDDSPSNLEISG
ncbi:AT-hook motif nuclear-localized protein 6-like [Chenopodium quinoa]|uniref:AT-hook motif nuclear-localized protein n=1 Tax=Chenopodium quinoa TaxID=63459 RepID=A0A803MTR0_CHEQI|nr:AT-hook motif nuclear-localized protein 6-like [Chenopodium quinoa]